MLLNAYGNKYSRYTFCGRKKVVSQKNTSMWGLDSDEDTQQHLTGVRLNTGTCCEKDALRLVLLRALYCANLILRREDRGQTHRQTRGEQVLLKVRENKMSEIHFLGESYHACLRVRHRVSRRKVAQCNARNSTSQVSRVSFVRKRLTTQASIHVCTSSRRGCCVPGISLSEHLFGFVYGPFPRIS